ncbi:MAG: HlyD family efflux transporter periplasmic adaptor subunit [Burkholderiaceae bacterium]
MTGQPLVFPAEVQAVPRIVQGETATYKARRQALQDALESTEQSLVLMRRELKVAQSMAAGGLMPEVEVMPSPPGRRARAAEPGSHQQFREQASAEQVRVQTELASLDDQLVVRDDALERTMLRSPVRGLVKNIRVNTVGGIVAAGSPIMEIVPLGGQVLVEARQPADIASCARASQPR